MHRHTLIILGLGLALVFGMFVWHTEQYFTNIFALIPYAAVLLPIAILKILKVRELSLEKNKHLNGVAMFLFSWLLIYNTLYYIFYWIDLIDLNETNTFRIFFYLSLPSIIIVVTWIVTKIRHRKN